MLNSVKFQEYMTLLGDVYDKEISDAKKDIYWVILKPYSDADCVKAFKQAIASCKWFPKPSELIDIIKSFVPEISIITKAENQLQFVLKWAKECSSVPNPKFKDPVTQHLVDTIWPQNVMMHKTVADMVWFAKDFKVAYVAHCEGCEGKLLLETNNKIKSLISGIG